MITAILNAIAALPKLFGLIKEGIVALSNWFKQKKIEERNEKFKDGVKKSKETKDTSNLDDLFGGRK